MPIPHRITDLLREGKVPAAVRRKGAEGRLPVSLPEKIEILAILSSDADEATRNQALSTLAAWETGELQRVFSDPGTPVFLLEFAAFHLVAGRQELASALLGNPALPGKLRESIQSAAPGADPRQPMREQPVAGEKQTAELRETLLQKIGRMSVVEKINAALMGSQEERAVLIRDSNKIVSRSVLQSPKLTDQEVESIAMMKNVSEEVLRLVATNRKFVRSYAVVRNLINNPRVPIDALLPFVNRLNDRDLRDLSRNKNVAGVLRTMAFKLAKQKEEVKRG